MTPSANQPAPKSVAASRLTMANLMVPEHTNPLGSIHGGVIMRFIDEAGGVCAIRHCRMNCVTAAVERLEIKAPVRVGELCFFHAAVRFTGRTSIMVGVDVEAEELLTGERYLAASALLTFVALENGAPRPVPPLICETDDERRLQQEARHRYETRKTL